ncbi:MAG: polyprenyl synthetase family protein [Pseudomonadota bacterium]
MTPSSAPAVDIPAISNKAASLDALQPVYALVTDDFAAVNRLIPEQISSDVNLVEDIGEHIVASGGKRLRPLMVLLIARGLGYSDDAHIRLAAIIEFLHTAMLLHDDVVDRSGLRRGKVTANELWGNAPSVLVGDFLYSRAFQMMVQVGSMSIMRILSDATNTIAEGEVLQLANVGNLQINEARYREIIRCKTALLFESATHTGAELAASADSAIPREAVEALRCFGLHFGMTYQLVDDWLDYMGDTETMGKNVGDDLAEGKLTLPLIYALQHAPTEQQQTVRDAIAARSNEQLERITEIVRRCGALDYTQKMALEEADRALACIDTLADTTLAPEFADALRTLTKFSTARLV